MLASLRLLRRPLSAAGRAAGYGSRAATLPPINDDDGGGERITVTHTITPTMLDQFAHLTGDHNPIHHATAADDGGAPPARLVHGALLNSIVAGVLGTRLPGAGTVVLGQTFEFRDRCVTDRPISVLVALPPGARRRLTEARYECRQDGRIVFAGTARLMLTRR